MTDDFVSWGGGSEPRRRWRKAIAVALAVPVLLVGIAATTRAVLDLDLWRHSGQRARDIAGQPSATTEDLQHATVAIYLDAAAHIDALVALAERPGEAGQHARAALAQLKVRIR